MSDNPGQDDVSIGIGATINQASVDEAKAQFKKEVEDLVKTIQDAMKSGTLGKVDLGTMKQIFTPEALGMKPEVVAAAFKQIEAGLAGIATGAEQAGEAIGQMGTKTAAAMANMGVLTEAWRGKVDGMKQAIQDYAKSSGASFADIQKAVAPKLDTSDRQAFNQAVRESVKEQKDAEKAAKDLEKQQKDLATSTLGLGDVFRLVFGLTMFALIRNFFQGFINQMKEAVQAGVDFTSAIFRLSVAIRDMQRKGVDVNIEDFIQMAKDLQQRFPTFSFASLIEGISDAALLTKELGFTVEQIKQVNQASITLAQLWGRDVNEVMRTMALTLSSGYSEGLQRLGLNINKVIITEKAHTMGVKEGYQAMTQQQRALAALAVIMDQVNGMEEDAAKFQETAAGKIAKTSASWTDLKRSVGEFTSVAWSRIMALIGGVLDIILKLWDAFRSVNEVLLTLTLTAASLPMVFAAALHAVPGGILGDPKAFFDKFIQGLKVAAGTAADEAKKIWGATQTPLGDLTIGTKVSGEFGLSDEEAQTVSDAVTDMNDKLADIAKQGADKLAQIERDKAADLLKIDEELYRDLQQAEIDHQRNLEKLATDYARRLVDLDTKAARDRASAQRDLANDLAKIERDNQEAILQARIKYDQDTLKREQDYQLKIKQMQEQYLFDIDEAIRSRNAKQALQITRRLKLEFGQAEDQHALDISQRKSDFEAELAELEREKQIRIQQRQQEFQQKMADLAMQAQQEKVDAQLKLAQDIADENVQYAQKRADLAAKAQQDRADRMAQYDQQRADLARSQQDQLRTLADGLVKQYNLTNNMLRAIYSSYLTYYGPNGALDQLYKYMVASAQNAAAQTAGALGKLGIPGVRSGTGVTGTGFAEGGSFIASSPMTATFGEKGTELVQVTPLSYLGRNAGKLIGSLPVGNSSSPGQRQIRLELLLSRDLEARIVSDSLNQMSDILVSVERER